MEKVINKSVDLQLEGLNGNAFALMGAFRQQAVKEGWKDAEIKAVLEEAKSSDYDYLLFVLSNHCEPQNSDSHDDE